VLGLLLFQVQAKVCFLTGEKVKLLAIKDDMKVCRDYRYYVGEYSEEAGSALIQSGT
jgi:hypothetical protein